MRIWNYPHVLPRKRRKRSRTDRESRLNRFLGGLCRICRFCRLKSCERNTDALRRKSVYLSESRNNSTMRRLFRQRRGWKQDARRFC